METYLTDDTSAVAVHLPAGEAPAGEEQNVAVLSPDTDAQLLPPGPDLFNAAVAIYYVMRGPNAATRTKQFAIKVALTNPSAPIPVYSTGFNGTLGFNSYVTLTALDPIDYSYPENRVVRETPVAIMSRSIGYQLFSQSQDTYTDHGGQISRRSTVVISPAFGGKFHTVENMSGLVINDSQSRINAMAGRPNTLFCRD